MSGIALLVLSSCAEKSTEPGGDGEVGLTLTARPPASDTVTASPVQAIVVQLRGENRRPSVGVTVRFTALQVAPGTGVWTMLVRPSAGDTYGTFTVVTTNALGQASVQVQYGTVAGPGWIEIAVPDLGILDTLTFTVQPGNQASLAVTPRDTAIHIGAAFSFTAHPQDRFGNPRAGSVNWEALTSPLAGGQVSAAGSFTASAISRARVIASSGITRDTVFVSVVPSGSYVARDRITGDLIYSDLDGSARRVFRAGPFRDEVEPAWSPAGNEIAVAPIGAGQMQFVSLDGSISSVAWTGAYTAAAYWPVYSRDGQFVYFSGAEGEPVGIFRIRRPGGTVELIAPGLLFRPSLSPDGRQVVFHFVANDVVIRVWDIAAQAYVSLAVPGRFAEWSPIGNEIVFHENDTGRIKIMISNGTNVRYLTPSGRFYLEDSQISWSSDGAWILARSAASIDLINVQSGLILPISASSLLFDPALKP